MRPALHLNLNSAALSAAKSVASGDSDTEKNLSFASVGIEEQLYTGSEILPNVVVKYDDAVLTLGTDYTIEYSDNTDIGTASVTITAVEGSGYTGSKTAYFSITSDISKYTLTTSQNYFEYTGTAITPSFVLKANGTTLVKGQDYVFDHYENTSKSTISTPSDAGVYYVVVKGTGNYSGTVRILYTITTVGDIYLSSQNKFDKANLSKLLKVISNDSTVTVDNMSAISTLAESTLNATGIRENDYAGKTSDNDILVTFGGLVWQVMYLSKDSDGNDILTLWLANSTSTSTWSSGWYSTSTGVTYPSNMYGTSYIRAVTLNGGGEYATSNTETLTATQSETNEFAKFTMTDIAGSLTKYLVTPSKISWQETQSSKTIQNTTYNYSNDAYSTSMADTGFYSSTYNYASILGSDTWANDYLWLPSVAETGYSSSYVGLWGTSTSQRSNVTYSSWLRSAVYNSASTTYYLDLGGASYTSSNVNIAYAVRPALHLNLNAAVEDADERDLESVDLVFEDVDWTGEEVSPVIVFGNYVLTEGTDYTITKIGDNVSVGIVSVTITGDGDYYSTLSFEFRIIKEITADHFEFAHVSSVQWTGSTFIVDVTVKDVDTDLTLTENTDYTLAFSSNTAAGSTVTITIAGMGCYYGSATSTFTITQRDITGETISISNIADQSYTGSAITPSFTVTDTGASKTTLTGTDYTYLFSENTNAGTATLTITGLGNYTGTRSTTFYIAPISLSSGTLTLSDTSFVYNGEENIPTVTMVAGGTTLTEGKDYTLTYHFSTADGEVVTNPTEVGTYYVILTGIGNYTSSKSATFSINKGTITADSITMSSSATIYNKEEQTPTFSVSVEGRTLEQTTDFTYAWYLGSTSGDVVTSLRDAGTYYLVITGCGSYTGTATKIFTISKLDITGGSITYEGDASTEIFYAGEAVTLTIQSVVTSYSNGSVVVESEGYTCTYSNNTSAGTATIVLTGVGNYQGTISKNFVISPGVLSSFTITIGENSGTALEVEYSGTAISPIIQVFDANGKVVSADDYSVTYSPSDFVNAGFVGVSIYAKQNGSSYNYSGSLAGSITIKALDISTSATASVTSTHTYDGTSQIPTFTVSYNGNELVSGTDYTYSCSDNVNASDSAKILITFTGNFTGSFTQTFTILKKDISLTTVEVADYEYTGSQIKPSVSVYDNINSVKTLLTSGTDYTITSYGENISVGNGSVTITGSGNYQGTKEITFNITSQTLASAVVNAPDVVYNGETNKTTISVVLGGTTLIENTDYTLVFSDDLINVGVVSVTITGMGSYTGLKVVTYQITARNLSNVTLTISGTYTFDRKEKTPTFTATDEDLNYTLDTDDYSVSYLNNINAGSATLTLTGKGNYTGTVSEQFTIIADTISSVTLESYSATYNAQAHEVKITSVTSKGGLTVLENEYRVGYSASLVNAGTITITISSATGNFEGTATCKFVINKAEILAVSLVSISATYDGNTHQPTISRVLAEGGLVLGVNEYDVSYYRGNSQTTDYTSAGTITVKINATENSNFKNGDGEIAVNFSISTVNINDLTIDYYDAISKEINNGDQTYVGHSVKPIITFVNHANEKVELTVTTDYTFGISNANGLSLEIFSEVGDYVVTTTGTGNFTGVVTKTYKVVARELIGSEMKYTITDKTYTGSAIELTSSDLTLQIYMSDKDGITGYQTLSWGTDFAIFTGYYDLDNEIGYDSEEEAKEAGATNILEVTDGYYANTDAGKANVFFKGINNFTSVVSLIFTINPAPITDAVVTLDDTTLTYDGTEKTPAVLSVVLDSKMLTVNLEYSITYSNNVNAGENALVTITGVNNYTGTVTATFTIEQRDISEASVVTLADLVYNASSRKQDVNLSFNGLGLVLSSDYTIQYQRYEGSDYNETSDFVNVGRIRIVITGIGNFKNTTSIEYSITPLSLTSSTITKNGTLSGGKYVLTDETYTGSITSKSITLTFNSTSLIENTDYSVSYSSDRINVGTVTITVSGLGNFADDLSFVYQIVTADISDTSRFEISLAQTEFVYTGSEITTTITIKDGETSISSFSTTYLNNINVTYSDGEVIAGAYVTITGTGNYTGTVSRSFKITPLTITSDTVTKGTISDVVYNGLERKLVPILTLGEVTLVENTDFTIAYKCLDGENYVATTDFINVGTIYIVVTGCGNFSGTINTYSYSITPASIDDSTRFTTTFDNLSFVYTGNEITLSFEIVDKTRNVSLSTANFDISYLNNINVAYENEVVTSGASITITGKGNYTGSITQNFTITPKSLADSDISIRPIAEQGYTGGEVTPNVIIVYNSILYTNTDATTPFTLSYSNNTNYGTATVIINGCGNFCEQTSTTFKISQSVASTTSFEIVVESGEYIFTGSAIKPNVTVKFVGSESELSADYYDVSYENNISAGVDTARIIVVFKENYVGTMSSSFTISARDIDDTSVSISTIDDITYDGQSHIVTPEIKLNSYVLTSNDFVCSYSTSSFVDVQTITITIKGTNNFSGTTERTYSILAKSLADSDIVVTITDSKIVYTGSEIQPSFTVKYGYITLENGVDFTVSYANNINAGTGTLTITAKSSNFVGDSQKNITFEIAKKTLEYSMLTEISSQTYTGYEIKPDLTIIYGSITLESGTDYEATYSNNIDYGVATVVVTACANGNYYGTFNAQFNILRLSLVNATITGVENSYYFSGHEINPEIEVHVFGYFEEDGQTQKKLTSGVDYIVGYSEDCLNAGEKTITITGQGNFKDLKSITFVVNKIDLSEATISGFEESLTYNYGDYVTQEISLSMDEVEIEVANYIVTYVDNLNAGTATMTVSSNNENIIGSITKEFTITKADPILTIGEDLSAFVGTSVSITLASGDTEGEFTFTPNKITAGSNSYSYIFTPTDRNNYNTITGSVTIEGINIVIDRIEATSSENLVDGNAFNISTISVKAIYNNGDTEDIINFSTNVADGETLSLQQDLIISYTNTATERTYECSLEVLRRTITQGEFTFENTDGFANDVQLVVQEITDGIEIYETLGENYNKIKNIEKVIVATLQSDDGTTQQLEGLSISFDVSEYEDDTAFYILQNGELVKLNVSNGKINLESGSQITLVVAKVKDEGGNKWIYITLIAVLSDIIVILAVSGIIRRKKMKTMDNSSNMSE